MAIPYKAVKRKTNPLQANSPERHYPQLVTLGRSVDLEATRTSERVQFVKLEDYLKSLGLNITALDGSGATQPGDGSGDDSGGVVDPGC